MPNLRHGAAGMGMSEVFRKGENVMCQQLPTIEVRQAFLFDCDECGKENLVRAVCPEMSDEERIEALDLFGYEPWEEADFVLCPEEVECWNCGTKFQVIYPGED